MENNSIKTIVYLTINTINNKIYVGVHITEDPYKFDNYWGCGITGTSSYWFKHPKTPFQKACKKYGLDVFKRYTLYVCDTYNDALNKERDIVNETFIKRADVYNVVLGGRAPDSSREIEVHQYDLNGNYLKSYKSYSDAGRFNKISYTSIHSAILTKGICCKSYWSETRTAKLDISNHKKDSKVKVYLYKSTGEYIKEIESMSDCAKTLETVLSCVQKAIKFGTKCSGYYISLNKVEKLDIKQYKRNTNKPVYQYDKNGSFIREFKNLREAREALQKPLKRLSCHIMEGTLYEGFYWSYIKTDFIKVSASKKKRIAQFDLNGNLIKIWDSYRECNKEFSNLRYVLNGSRSNTKGFVFKYTD